MSMRCETVCIESKESGYIVVNKEDAPEDAKILTEKQCAAIDKKNAPKESAEPEKDAE